MDRPHRARRRFTQAHPASVDPRDNGLPIPGLGHVRAVYRFPQIRAHAHTVHGKLLVDPPERVRHIELLHPPSYACVRMA